jgi:predicted transglutaminase-like protease
MSRITTYIFIVLFVGIGRLNAQSQSVKITVGTSEFIATLENQSNGKRLCSTLAINYKYE